MSRIVSDQLIVRPVQEHDLDDLFELAGRVGLGMTSLPPDKDVLRKKIQASINSFVRTAASGSDYFLLVMEDQARSKVVGTAGIYAKTGSAQAFYNYRLTSLTHYSLSLDRQIRHDTLNLTNDYTDCSEIGTLIVDPDYRGNGAWLAKCRYLLIQNAPSRFSPTLIASLRGYIDGRGMSPFWEGVGRKFFAMDFDEADRLSGRESNQFITELMPRHAIYTSLLSDEAREAIGRPHKDSERALNLLYKEGFRYDQVVDIFDAGPYVAADSRTLLSMKNACRVRKKGDALIQQSANHNGAIQLSSTDNDHLVANTSLAEFRAKKITITDSMCLKQGAIQSGQPMSWTANTGYLSELAQLSLKNGDSDFQCLAIKKRDRH